MLQASLVFVPFSFKRTVANMIDRCILVRDTTLPSTANLHGMTSVASSNVSLTFAVVELLNLVPRLVVPCIASHSRHPATRDQPHPPLWLSPDSKPTC